MEASVITTYRCLMRSKMCDIWDNPTDLSKEFKSQLLERLPKLNLVNLTGGEPFVRQGLDEIIRILFTKTGCVVISTSGRFEGRIFKLAEQFPNLGFCVNLEGLSQKNDELRSHAGGFDRGLRTLLRLR